MALIWNIKHRLRVPIPVTGAPGYFWPIRSDAVLLEVWRDNEDSVWGKIRNGADHPLIPLYKIRRR